jgi:hypothetical protein
MDAQIIIVFMSLIGTLAMGGACVAQLAAMVHAVTPAREPHPWEYSPYHAHRGVLA